ncbi:MAG: insulinase family protein [Acidobacteria bacterium]|nr:insulinase family protein [Acidobacteriota bacterium]
METKSTIHKTQLENGLVVVSEPMSHVRSVSFGVFLREGSRHESHDINGINHFIEHTLFKGTRRRTAVQIADESDALGGYLDAFTARESVGFTNKVLDEHLPQAFELIADLVTAPTFDPTELDKERNVILEEIKMVEDTPDDLVFEIFSEGFYPNHALGRPILGTPETLATFKSKRVRQYYEDAYRPENLVIAAAGNITHEALLELVNQHFGHLRSRQVAASQPEPAPTPHITLRHKSELEQSHLVLGAVCPSLMSEDHYAVNVLCTILGGGMSSRLFQSVREDRGLVYTILSSLTEYVDTGFLSIYAGASSENIEPTITATVAELRRLKNEPISAVELQRNKDQLKTSLMLALESSSARMNALASQEMTWGEFLSPDEVIEEINAVTAEDVQRLACEIFQPEAMAVTVLGDVDGLELERDQLG